MVVGARPREPVIGGDVVVEADRRVGRRTFRRLGPREGLRERINRRGHSTLAHRRADVSQQLGDNRVDGRRVAVLRGERHQIHRPARILELPLLGERAHDGAVGRVGARGANPLVVDEEKGLVLPDGAAHPDAGLVLVELRLVGRLAGDRVDIAVKVEPRVRVEPLAPHVVVRAALEPVRARARDEPHLGCALAAHVGALGRRRHGDFFDRVQARADAGEHAVPRLGVVVLDVHPVEGDVHRTLREAVHRAIAEAAGGGRHAGHVAHQLEGSAADDRQARDLLGAERRSHGRGLGLDDLGRARHHDGLFEGAEREHCLHVGDLGHVGDNVVQDRRLEAHQRHGHAVGAWWHGWDRERTVRPAHGVVDRARRDALDDDVGTGNDGSRCVGHSAGDRGRRPALRKRGRRGDNRGEYQEQEDATRPGYELKHAFSSTNPLNLGGAKPHVFA